MSSVAPQPSREEVIDSSQGSRKYVFVPPQHEAIATFLYGLDEEGVDPGERMSLAKLAATRQHEYGLPPHFFYHKCITEETIFQEITHAISAAEAARTSIENFTARGREPITLLESVCKEFGPRQSQSSPPRPAHEMEEFLPGDIACYNYIPALEQDAEKRKGILEYARRRYNKICSRGVLDARLDSFGDS